MATVKRITDLGQYAGVLPYASEMFGIYQPLLGWKSKRIAERIERGIARDKAQVIRPSAGNISSVKIQYDESGQLHIDISAGQLRKGAKRIVDSIVLERISQSLPPYEQITTPPFGKSNYGRSPRHNPQEGCRRRVHKGVRSASRAEHHPAGPEHEAGLEPDPRCRGDDVREVSELRVPGCRHASNPGQPGAARRARRDLLRFQRQWRQGRVLEQDLIGEDPTTAHFDLESLDPTDAEQLKDVALSPISVVHLFRQYFFELDTFPRHR